MNQATQSTTLLRAHGLSRRFGGLRAVDDVDLELRRGEIFGLIGPNGAGKSTLFRLLAGIMRPSAGRIEFEGAVLAPRTPHIACRAGIAATHQIVRPFRAMTLLDNAMVGAFYGRPVRPPRAEAQTIALDALTLCGLGERAGDAAHTLNLSGQKRLEIARALATRPRLLLLDEVLAGLNATETDRTLELVRTINARDVTVVMVEHNLRAVRGVCSRLAVLVEGRKIVEGLPEVVLADARVVEAYIGKPRA